MEYVARTVVHPNGSLDERTARAQLSTHPKFKPGTVIVKMTRQGKRWVANLHEPKVAAPPFLGEGGPSEDAPTPSEPKKDEPPKSEGDDKPKDDEGDEKKEDKGEGKPSIEKVFELVQQIADAVGVHHGGPDAGAEGPLGDLPPGGDPLAGGPPKGPEGGPAHDETSPVPGAPDTKQIIHRKAPPGSTPIGAPAFASTKPRVASFEVQEVVPDDFKIAQAKQEIEAMYAPHGYKVKKIIEATDEQGRRVIQARVSVR